MKSRLRYKSEKLEPEVHVTLSPAELWVVTQLIYNNLCGSHPVRDDLGNFTPDTGFYAAVRKVFGGEGVVALGGAGNNIEDILLTLPAIKC